MRDLRIEPLWQEQDLGAAIPDVRHACSVCFPTWQSVIDYEEGRDKVMRKLEAGYPRFVFHPDVATLFSKVRASFANADQDVICRLCDHDGSDPDFLRRSGRICAASSQG